MLPDFLSASLEDGRLMLCELEEVANGRYCAVLAWNKSASSFRPRYRHSLPGKAVAVQFTLPLRQDQEMITLVTQ